MKRWLMVLLGFAISGTGFGQEETPARIPDQTQAQGVIRLDETVISGNQELPKVLYILPWRDPDGLPEVELDTGSSESELFRRLYPPAYRRELTYFESLEPKKSKE